MNFTKSYALPVFFCSLLFFPMSHAHAKQKQQKNKPENIQASLFPSASEIAEARELLRQLGYWVIPEAVRFDTSLRHALIAFQKIEGRKRTGILTAEELNAIRTAHQPTAMEAGVAHIEVDLQRQVLFLVDSEGLVSHILPVSSGSGQLYTQDGVTQRAVTPLGHYKIERKILGWRKSALGLLYYPNYFHGGFAIHGNPSVPAYPASHGCIRIPMFASQEFSTIATVGMDVLVHNGTLQ